MRHKEGGGMGRDSGANARDAIPTALPADATPLGIAPVPDEGVCHALGDVDTDL